MHGGDKKPMTRRLALHHRILPSLANCHLDAITLSDPCPARRVPPHPPLRPLRQCQPGRQYRIGPPTPRRTPPRPRPAPLLLPQQPARHENIDEVRYEVPRSTAAADRGSGHFPVGVSGPSAAQKLLCSHGAMAGSWRRRDVVRRRIVVVFCRKAAHCERDNRARRA